MIIQIGQHKIQHGNIMDGIDELMGGMKAEIFYCDPPWGSGNLKYWQTINQRDNNLAMKAEIDFNDFLVQLFRIIVKFTKGVSFLEYGQRWKPLIISKAEEFNLYHYGVEEIVYKAGNKLLPMHLHVMSKGNVDFPANYSEIIHGKSGDMTARNAIKPFIKKGGILLDPCCGTGAYAMVAAESGMIFCGNEINEKRFRKTVERLKGGGYNEI